MKTVFSILLMLSAMSVTFAQNIVKIGDDDIQLEVLDLTGAGKIQWGGYEEIGAVARSEKNGATNTKAIVMAVGGNSGYNNNNYAAKLCDTTTAGGHDDWYLPAKDEANLIYLNMKDFGWSESMTLWTSTEASGTQAVSLYTYNGTWYNVAKVDSYNMVCVRKIK